MDEKEQIAQQIMINFMKILSAAFDSNGGTLTLDRKTLEGADIRFYVTGKVDGDNIILTKVNGESELYHKHFPPKN